MNLTAFVILSAATWRVSMFLVKEAGPFGLFRRIRELVGIGHDQDGAVLTVPDRFLPQLLSCVWCTSVWIGALWAGAWALWPRPTLFLASILAISTVAILIDNPLSARQAR